MKKKSDQSADTAELRRRAEERLGEKRKSQKLEAGNQSTADDTARLVHELQVHQIELEMQNEELWQAHAQVEMLLAQYTDLYDFAPAGYLPLDREGAIRQMNLTGARLLGVERSQLVNRRFGLFGAGGDRRTFSDFLQKVFASEAKESCEVTLLHESSHPVVVRIEGTRSADGQECRAVMLEITERRQMQKRLGTSERKSQAIFDLAFGFIGLLTPDGVLVEINRSALDFAGVQLSDVVGKPFWETPWWTHSTDEQGRVRAAVRTAASGEMMRFETTSLATDGVLHTFDFSVKPVKDESGRVVLLIPEGRDITDRKRMEEGLARTAREWQTTFDATNDAIWISDQNHRILRTNKMAESYFKRPCSEMLGKPCCEIVHGTTEPLLDFPFVRARKSGHRETMDLQRGEHWLEVIVDPILDAAGHYAGAVHIVSDITKRRKLEEQFRQVQKMEAVG